MNYPYKLNTDKVITILDQFNTLSRSYIIALNDVPLPIEKRSVSVDLEQFDSCEKAVRFMQHHWSNKTTVILSCKDEQEYSLIQLIKRVLSLEHYFLLVQINDNPKTQMLLKSLRSVEMFDVAKAKRPSDTKIKEKGGAETPNVPHSLIEAYLNFEKKRPDDRKLIEKLRKNPRELVHYLYEQGNLSKNNPVSLSLLLQYTESVNQILSYPQASYIQGRLFKWLTYEFNENYKEAT